VTSLEELCSIIDRAELDDLKLTDEWTCRDSVAMFEVCYWSGITCKDDAGLMIVNYPLIRTDIRRQMVIDLFYDLAISDAGIHIDVEDETSQIIDLESDAIDSSSIFDTQESLLAEDGPTEDSTAEPTEEPSAEPTSEPTEETTTTHEPSSSVPSLAPVVTPAAGEPSIRPSVKGETVRPSFGPRPTRAPTAIATRRPSAQGETSEPSKSPSLPQIIVFAMSQVN
jgi:hypothetical protein